MHCLFALYDNHLYVSQNFLIMFHIKCNIRFDISLLGDNPRLKSALEIDHVVTALLRVGHKLNDDASEFLTYLNYISECLSF